MPWCVPVCVCHSFGYSQGPESRWQVRVPGYSVTSFGSLDTFNLCKADAFVKSGDCSFSSFSQAHRTPDKHMTGMGGGTSGRTLEPLKVRFGDRAPAGEKHFFNTVTHILTL